MLEQNYRSTSRILRCASPSAQSAQPRKRRTYENHAKPARMTRYAERAELVAPHVRLRSEEHTSELQSQGHISYAVFCLICCRACRRHHRFFFNDTATTEIYTLSLHDALPIWLAVGTTGSARSAYRVIWAGLAWFS